MKEEDIRALTSYRLQQAKESLDDAKFLLEGQRSHRSVVNRAYYAMFYAVLALLQKIEKTPHKHSGVMNLFDTEFVLKGVFPKELSKNFHKAFDLRQASDYQAIEPITEEETEETLNKASGFVRSIKEYLSSDQSGEK